MLMQREMREILDSNLLLSIERAASLKAKKREWPAADSGFSTLVWNMDAKASMFNRRCDAAQGVAASNRHPEPEMQGCAGVVFCLEWDVQSADV